MSKRYPQILPKNLTDYRRRPLDEKLQELHLYPEGKTSEKTTPESNGSTTTTTTPGGPTTVSTTGDKPGLPNTGERNSLIVSVAGVAMLIVAVGTVLHYRKK